MPTPHFSKSHQDHVPFRLECTVVDHDGFLETLTLSGSAGKATATLHRVVADFVKSDAQTISLRLSRVG